jgi:hypothetical protein
MKSSTRSVSPRALVGRLYVVIVAGLVVGVAAFGNYFLAEHHRLSFWDGVLVWFGDGVALFWATVYFVRHTLLGVPLVAPPGSARRIGFFWVAALASILTGLGADLWKTLSLRRAEREAFDTACRTVGTVHAATKVKFEQNDRVAYALHCRYADANQVVHTAVFHLRDPEELPKLPPAVAQAVRAEQFPVAVAVAYDADRPARCWLADLGWRDMTRLHGFSICVLFFQAQAAGVFLLCLALARGPAGGLPWWYDLHAVVLAAVEAAVVLLFGGVTLLFGYPMFWGDF